MTTWLCCDGCGMMSFASCTDGWLPADNDKHHCSKCRANAMLKRARDTDREPHCCLVGCDADADVEIRHGPKADDYTHACTAHIGDLLTDEYQHTITAVIRRH
jgi:hypothetical protein